MKRRICIPGLALTALFVLIIPNLAAAQCGSAATSVFPNHILVCPSGDISVVGQVNDATGAPCPGNTIFMQFANVCSGLLCAAPGQPYPILTTVTNAAGQAIFWPRIGGCCMVGSVTFYDASGTVLAMVPTVNSPDVNGDCIVNLSDIGMFAAAYFGVYQPCCDFTMDGVLNLSDISIMASHIGH